MCAKKVADEEECRERKNLEKKLLESEEKCRILEEKIKDVVRQQQEELAAARRKLEKREIFLDDMMHAAPWGISCVNGEGQIVYVNHPCADAFNIDADSKKLPLFYEIIPPNLRKKHMELFDKCLQGFTSSFLEKDSLPQKPQFGYIYGVYNPVMNSAGKVEFVVIVAINITEQKEKERQLVEAQCIAKMGSYEWILQEKRFACSEGLLALFQVDQEMVNKESYHVLLEKVHPEDADYVRDVFCQLLKNHLAVQWEFRIQHGDQDIHTLQSTNSLDFDSAGNPVKIVGSLIDIAERKQLEKLQQEAATRLREFARTMPDIGFIATEGGQIVEMFGDKEMRDKKPAVKDLKNLLCKKDAGELMKEIQYALLHNTVQFGEYMTDTDRGRRMFEIRIAPMSYVADGKRTVACNAIDVTDKNRAQRFLQFSYEQRRQREILNDLVEGRVTPSQFVLDQAWRVKLNLARPFSFYLVVIKSWRGKPLANWLDYQEGYQFFIDSLSEVLATEMKAIVWESREGISVLCPLLFSGKDIKGYELSTASRMKELVGAYFPDASIVIGIGEFHADTLQKISLVYSQACEAVYSGQKMCPEQGIHHYLDLGIFQILPLLSDRDKVISFIERTIGKLLEYDRKRDSHLVTTMEKILQIDNLKIVAEQMFVHPKTIAFRKKRIEKILGISLDTLDNKTTLNTALKLRQLFYLKKEEQAD